MYKHNEIRAVLDGAASNKRGLTAPEVAKILGNAGEHRNAVLTIVNSNADPEVRLSALVDYFTSLDADDNPEVEQRAREAAVAEVDEQREHLVRLMAQGQTRDEDAERYPHGALFARAFHPERFEQRAPVTITSVGGTGRAPVGTDYGTTWVDLVREQSAFLSNAPLSWFYTDRTELDIPLVSADSPAAAANEGDSLTGGAYSGLDASALKVTPTKRASYEALSSEVWEDAQPSMLEAFSLGVVKRHALAWESLVIATAEADGSSVGGDANFGSSLDAIADAVSAIEAAGGTANAIVTTPAIVAILRKLKEAAGSTRPVLFGGDGGPAQAAPVTVYGVPVYSSSAVTATKMVVCDARQIAAVVRREPLIEVSKDALFGTDQVAVRAVSRFAAKVIPTNAAVVRVLTDAA